MIERLPAHIERLRQAIEEQYADHYSELLELLLEHRRTIDPDMVREALESRVEAVCEDPLHYDYSPTEQPALWQLLDDLQHLGYAWALEPFPVELFPREEEAQ